ASKPFISGIITSSTTRSGLHSAKSFAAAAPLSASTMSKPADSSTSRCRNRSISSSSAIRISGFGRRKEPVIMQPATNGWRESSRDLGQTGGESGLCLLVVLDDGCNPCRRIGYGAGPCQRFKLFAVRRQQDGPDIGARRL